MAMPEARLPTGGGAAPEVSRSHRVWVVATVVLALTTMGLGIWVLFGQDRSGESTLPTLEFLRFGDPADSPYCLPYPEGESYFVNNSYSRRGSHIGRFAYDFAMPFGAEIAAARAGTVSERRDQYSDDDRRGGHENGVFVVHDDGTMAAYLHMREEGVLVDVGDEVAAGDVIGFVGTSGTAPDNPHLHFEVFEGQGEGSQWYKTLPVNFRNAKGAFDERGGLAESDYEALTCPF
jgi:murein DD-endopeptidase MepM/ murein hydrolase activator NlpD